MARLEDVTVCSRLADGAPATGSFDHRDIDRVIAIDVSGLIGCQELVGAWEIASRT